MLSAIIGGGAIIRFHFAAFLDPFEDGYQNWWISANLVSTGQYWDRHSMMTQGNWLPLYHFFAAGVLELAGLRSIDALKAANVVLSSLTAVTIFLASRKRGPIIALAATGFFSFNLIDIVVSGWATAETLTSFLVLVGYAMLFQATRPRVGRIWIAAAALALAVMTRYEAWLIVCLMLIYIVLVDSGQQRRRMLVALLPAIGLMAAYFAYSAQWGFLPAIVVRQTSTDIQYQLSVGSQPTPMTLLSRWWTGYISFFPLVLLVADPNDPPLPVARVHEQVRRPVRARGVGVGRDPRRGADADRVRRPGRACLHRRAEREGARHHSYPPTDRSHFPYPPTRCHAHGTSQPGAYKNRAANTRGGRATGAGAASRIRPSRPARRRPPRGAGPGRPGRPA